MADLNNRGGGPHGRWCWHDRRFGRIAELAGTAPGRSFTGLGQWSCGRGDALAGVSIDRAGRTHYGWMRVSIDAGGDPWLPRITEHDWAWEDQPGVPIAAGAAPGALAAGLLALVALGRRKEP